MIEYRFENGEIMELDKAELEISDKSCVTCKFANLSSRSITCLTCLKSGCDKEYKEDNYKIYKINEDGTEEEIEKDSD